MRNSYLNLLVLFLFLSCNNSVKVKEIDFIPIPAEIKFVKGSFNLNDKTVLQIDENSKLKSDLIKKEVEEISGLKLSSQKSDYNSIQFDIVKTDSNQYRLSINSDRIRISAGSDIALLYGFQSLTQVLYQSDEKSIPALEIIDSPGFEWRGMLLDCSRHFMEKEFVKRYIDLLALYKMNVLHWHLTEDQGWRIQIDKYPRLTEIGAWREGENGKKYGGFYTKEDIRELVSYAKDRGIRIVPEIELPGHSLAALASYPHLSCSGGPFKVETEWGVFKDIYCAGNDSSFIFLEDVLSEVIELFPSKYIHIGGDEAPIYRWEQCDKCQKRMKEEGLNNEHELQGYFVNRIGQFLESNGKIMIGWDEILEGGLPDNAIVQSWRGFEGAKSAILKGHKSIVSPTSHAYFDYGLNDIDMEKVYSFNPIPEGTPKSKRHLILGAECNMWTERAPQEKVDSKVFPRILAMAEVLWANTDKKDYVAFRKRVSSHYSILDRLDVKYGFEKSPIEIKTEIIHGKLKASIYSYDSSINIYFQKVQEKIKYDSSVWIENKEDWKITFSRNGKFFEDTIKQGFYPHLALGKELSLEFPYHDNYGAGGIKGLTNGKTGSNHFRDGNWQGYWGNDVIATLDLGVEKELQKFSSGYLQYNNAWIFFPEFISYEISQDGMTFNSLGTIKNTKSPRNKEQIIQEYTLTLDESVKARFVRLRAKNIGICPEWHDAAGSKAWIFIDEFCVE